MRYSSADCINDVHVHKIVLSMLLAADLLKSSDKKCTAHVVWSILLAAAARMISISLACLDLKGGPCDQSIYDALDERLIKTPKVLIRKLNELLSNDLPRFVKKRKLRIAIDWHLVPYYGEPLKSKNELVRSQPKQGTSTFHVYATACIIDEGMRYTLAITQVKSREKTLEVLARLVTMLREKGLKIRCLLLDRQFYSDRVIGYLMREKIPFIMPVVFKGGKRKSKKQKSHGLALIRQQRAGWYRHCFATGKHAGDFDICVSYKSYKHRKTGKRHHKKLLYACWGNRSSPPEIRELYRKRFGIETSYRQKRQAQIYTTTRDPLRRLLYTVIALVLRNVWVALNWKLKRSGSRKNLSFKRLLNWIANAIIKLFQELFNGETSQNQRTYAIMMV